MKLIHILLTASMMLFGAVSAQAQAVSGQGTWEATLLGRDINLNAVAATDASAVYLYDTTLNVTWLRNANVNGLMNWGAANAWAANLVTGSGTTAINDWRLPTMAANPTPTYSTDGSTAFGYNVPTSSSELASLFYSTLGNKAYVDASGNVQAGFGLTNAASFQNMQTTIYWLDKTFAPDQTSAWFLSPHDGGQGYELKANQWYAMAVRTGDVLAPVPEPETYAMLLAGLGLIGAVARRRQTGKQVSRCGE